MFGNLFGKFLNKGQQAPEGSEEKMQEMMNNPQVQKAVAELQKRLSPEDQKKLFRMAMSRDAAGMQKFIKEKVPDFEDIMRGV